MQKEKCLRTAVDGVLRPPWWPPARCRFKIESIVSGLGATGDCPLVAVAYIFVAIVCKRIADLDLQANAKTLL
ncbi:MAG: hypothetical protein WAK72_25485, partial [Pseudolabrys sp.]